MLLNKSNFEYIKKDFLFSHTGFDAVVNRDFYKNEVLVVYVAKDSVAKEKGIEIGDKLLKINNNNLNVKEFLVLKSKFRINSLNKLEFDTKEVSFNKSELSLSYNIEDKDESYIKDLNKNFNITSLINIDLCTNELDKLNILRIEIENKKSKHLLKKLKKCKEYLSLLYKMDQIESKITSNPILVFSKKAYKEF